MRVYFVVEAMIVSVGILSELLPSAVTTQVVRRAPATVAPGVVASAPAVPNEPTPMPMGDRGMRRGNHTLRGSELIGMHVWGARNQRLGTIRDIVIDYQEGCPMLLAAVSSDISGGPDGYVLVPFDARQLQYDNRLRRDYLVLDLGLDQFRNAPRIERDNWDRIRDPQFLTRTRQFYQKTERSAARPVMPPEHGAGTGRDTDRERIDTERSRANTPVAPTPHGGSDARSDQPAPERGIRR
jgi:sporulation protein YlmC with PRC-barrel domain